MTILQRRSRKVKATRHSRRPDGPFGAGLVRPAQAYRVIAIEEDERQAALAFERQREREDALMAERAADRAEAEQRASEGWRW